MPALGTPELTIIVVIILIVILGPRGASEILRAFGQARNELDRASGEVQVPIKEVVAQVSDPQTSPQDAQASGNAEKEPNP